MIFNIILDTVAEQFISTAGEKGWGLCLADGSWVDLILFADNYWLVATSPQMLKSMTGEWLRLLGEVGWLTPYRRIDSVHNGAGHGEDEHRHK